MDKQTGGNAIQRLMWASPSAYAEINKDRAQAVLDAWLADIEGEDDDAMELRVNRSIEKFLDVDSISYFVQIISRNRDRAFRSAMARKGSDETHKEHRAMKAEVFVWLDENRPKFKSMDDAALAITKLQPIKFRTAREWVGDWKKLRSASTP